METAESANQMESELSLPPLDLTSASASESDPLHARRVT